MKTLVLVLSCRAKPYPQLIDTIKRTWASVRVEDVDVLFYYGGDALRSDGRDLDLPVPDDLAHVGHKTLAAFEYVLAHRDFDLIFRTNSSSYVDLPNLSDYVGAHGLTRRYYAGRVARYGPLPFASGAGFFLSRDLVAHTVERQAAWNHGYLDDVALAELLSPDGIQPVPAPRVEVGSRREARRVDTAQFLFRCKTESRSRRKDIAIMRDIHRAFERAR